MHTGKRHFLAGETLSFESREAKIAKFSKIGSIDGQVARAPSELISRGGDFSLEIKSHKHHLTECTSLLCWRVLMDSKKFDFIASFAKSTTTVSSVQYDWVARRGKYSLYTVLTDLAPTVRQ